MRSLLSEQMNIEKGKIERYSSKYDKIIEKDYQENRKIKSKYIRQNWAKIINRLKEYKENHFKFLYDFNVHFDSNL